MKIQLNKQCPRTIPNALDPIKKPRMNCIFRKYECDCSLHPEYKRFTKIRNGNWFEAARIEAVEHLTLKVRCVLFNEYGMSIVEQRGYDKARKSIERLEIAQSKKDSKILNSIKKHVSTLIFEDINYELEESDHWVNLRIIDSPEGKLDRTTENNLKVYVNQHSVGDSGDSFAGTVCIELPWNKYLTWDFWM